VPSTPLLDQLRGGDRRSIGRPNAVAQEVVGSPRRFPELVAGLWHPDALVRMRAGDALEKVSRHHPGWLWPLRGDLLGLARIVEEHEARWHLAQILPRLGLRGARGLTRAHIDACDEAPGLGIAQMGIVGP